MCAEAWLAACGGLDECVLRPGCACAKIWGRVCRSLDGRAWIAAYGGLDECVLRSGHPSAELACLLTLSLRPGNPCAEACCVLRPGCLGAKTWMIVFWRLDMCVLRPEGSHAYGKM
eukprot:519838-Pelagomonas_calceolata.AAC.1